MRHVIGDELQDRSGRFREPTGNRNVQMTAARNNDLCASAIDCMKIVFVRNPHARQAGKVIDLTDAAQRLIH